MLAGLSTGYSCLSVGDFDDSNGKPSLVGAGVLSGTVE